jgi:hypothetical protein
MPIFMQPIYTQTVGAGGSGLVTFNNIPQNFTDLVIKCSTRTNRAAVVDALGLRFNGVSSGYTFSELYATGSGFGTGAANGSAGGISLGYPNGNDATANTFGMTEILIPNYTNSRFKYAFSEATSENAAQASFLNFGSGYLPTNNPITSISFYPWYSSLILQNSTFTLYGITRQDPAAKATGGSIYYDSTYFYHVFTQSDIFKPTTNLTGVDYLVVAGGGGQGGGFAGGGGGAGGYLSSLSGGSSMSLTAGIDYSVLVGAGGAAYVSGNNSSFNNIVATGGGRGTGSFVANGSFGVSGGSGGGMGINASGWTYSGGLGNTPATSPSQGNNGGGFSGAYNAPYAGSGGGGSSAAAASNVNAAGTDGGAGTSNAITGVTLFYSGGGGGGSHAGTGKLGGSGVGGQGSSGNGGGTLIMNPQPGAQSRGGGAGGMADNVGSITTGIGGSGIVVLRYLR